MDGHQAESVPTQTVYGQGRRVSAHTQIATHRALVCQAGLADLINGANLNEQQGADNKGREG